MEERALLSVTIAEQVLAQAIPCEWSDPNITENLAINASYNEQEPAVAAPLPTGANYNAHDLAVVLAAGLDPESDNCEWNTAGRLTSLFFTNNNLTTLDLSGCSALEQFFCLGNNLTTLDLSGCTALKVLGCRYYNLTTLDVSGCTALKRLNCEYNNLTTLDVSGCTALTTLYGRYNNLTTLDVSKNTALEGLYCSGNNLTTLDVSKNTAIVWLECDSNNLTTLDVSKNTALEGLYCIGNNLTTLDVSQNTALKWLGCGDINLTTLDLSKNTHMSGLSYYGDKLNTVIVNPAFASNYSTDYRDPYLVLYNHNRVPPCEYRWRIKTAGGTDETVGTEFYYTLQSDQVFPLYCDLYEEGATEPFQTITICLEVLYNENDVARLKEFLNQSGNGRKVNAEYDADDPATYGVTWEIMDGEYRLTAIDWRDKDLAGDLDLLACDKLETLKLSGNPITSIAVEDCVSLKVIEHEEGELTLLFAEGCTHLEYINVKDNKLSDISLDECAAIKYLYVAQNPLATLDLSKLTALEKLECYSTELVTLDISKNISLTSAMCYSETLVSILVDEKNPPATTLELTRFNDNGDVVMSDYRWLSLNEYGVWNSSLGSTNQYALAAGTDFPLYCVVYGAGNSVIHKTVRVYGNFFLEPELLTKQNNFDHWKKQSGKTATLIDPLNFNPKTGIKVDFDDRPAAGLQQYVELPYKIDKVWTDESTGLDAYGLVPTEVSKKLPLWSELHPILLFPGTDDRARLQTGSSLHADLLADFCPEGVGYKQMLKVVGNATSWLKNVPSPNVYGYSLGAALAQWTIAQYKGSVYDVILFNASGISYQIASQWSPSRAHSVTYHIASGDLVSMAGESYLPGTVLIHSYMEDWSIPKEKTFGDVLVDYIVDALATPIKTLLPVRYAKDIIVSAITGYLDEKLGINGTLGEYVADKHLRPMTVPYSFPESTSETGTTFVFTKPRTDSVKPSIESATFKSYWFHYENPQFLTDIYGKIPAIGDLVSIRGTAEHGRAILGGVIHKTLSDIQQHGAMVSLLGAIQGGLLGKVVDTVLDWVGTTVQNVADSNLIPYVFNPDSRKVSLTGGWQLTGVNTNIKRTANGLLESADVTVVDPFHRTWAGKLNYANYGLQSLSVDLKTPLLLVLNGAFFIDEAQLKMTPNPVDVYDPNAIYSLEGPGKISFADASFAAMEGKIAVKPSLEMTETNLTVGEGDFFEGTSIGTVSITDDMKQAKGLFSGSLLNELLVMSDASVVMDEQFVMVGNESTLQKVVTIKGTAEHEGRNYSVNARYYGADNWTIELTDSIRGFSVTLDPEHCTLTPDTLTYNAGFVLETMTPQAALLSNSSVAQTNVGQSGTLLATTGTGQNYILHVHWTTPSESPDLNFKVAGVTQTESEMVESGLLEPLSLLNSGQDRYYATSVSSAEMATWSFLSHASLGTGNVTLYSLVEFPVVTITSVHATVMNQTQVTATIVAENVNPLTCLVWTLRASDGHSFQLLTENAAAARVDENQYQILFDLTDLQLSSGNYTIDVAVGSEGPSACSNSFELSWLSQLTCSTFDPDFGAVDIGGPWNATLREMTVTNSGNKTISFDITGINGSDFNDFYLRGQYESGEALNTSRIVLRRGESITLAFAFVPENPGEKTLTLQFIDTESQVVQKEITLTGTANDNNPLTAVISTPIRVQEGCSLYLCADNSTGGDLTYFWNFSDSESDEYVVKNSSCWISARELQFALGTHTIRLKVTDAFGRESQTVSASLQIVETSPCITIDKYELVDGQILKLNLSAFYYSRSAQKWTINWGDGSDNSVYNSRSNCLTSAHYYAASEQTQTYDITLNLVDSNGNGGDITYDIGSHTVLGTQTANAENVILIDTPDQPMISNGNENDSIITVTTDLWYESIIEPLGATALWDQQSDSVSLSDTHLLPPIKTESRATQSAKESSYQPIAATGLNNASASVAVLESHGNDDSDILEGIDALPYHKTSSLKSSLESELFGNDELDDLFIPYWE